MAIGSARPLEDATRIAYRELVYWLEKEYGIPRYDAYMLLRQFGFVRLGNVVDPEYSVGAGIKKTLLEKLTSEPTNLTRQLLAHAFLRHAREDKRCQNHPHPTRP